MKLKVEDSFLLSHILKCGQTFRYEELGEEKFSVCSADKRIMIEQKGNIIDVSCSEEEFNSYWRKFFDLDLNYGEVKEKIREIEPKISDYIDKLYGIRILKQEPFEMFITFIISQNNSMYNIKRVVTNICENYGEKKEDEFGVYYAFPSVEALSKVSREEFRELKAGFRDKYLVDAISKINSGEINLNEFYELSTKEGRKKLMTIKGVGRKVADCILLFGYYKMDVFPVDVWIRRALTNLYFEGQKVKDEVLLDKAYEVFGDLSGIAQQYVFYGIIEENKK